MDAIILAAGSSVRFGNNKLLHMLDGKPVYRYILEVLFQKQKEHRLRHLIVVSQYDEIFEDIREHFPGVITVRNPAPERGISSSLRLGLYCLLQQDGRSLECLFTVADQPGFTERSFEKMLDFRRMHTYGITAAGCTAQPGQTPQIKNPVIFSSQYYKALQELTGDAGGKQVLCRHLDDTGLCEIPAAELEDLDTQESLLRFENRISLIQHFPFLKETGHVISMVGAGGKTTLMDTLASCYAQLGSRVIVTTTTHIWYPKQYPVAYHREQLYALLSSHRIAAAGADAPGGKLRMAEGMRLSDYRDAADVVLIEADGAKGLPCKVPTETEPVILPESDLVVGVMGMDALDQPLSEVCFRREQAMQLLGVEETHRMTEEDLARILLSDQGTRKDVKSREYYIVLNKCENKALRKRAGRIQQRLEQAGAEHVVCTSLNGDVITF